MATAARPPQGRPAPEALAAALASKALPWAPSSARSGSDARARHAPASLSCHRRERLRICRRRRRDRGCPRAWLRFALEAYSAGRGSRGLGPETGRQRQPQTKARAARAIGTIEHFDSAAVHERVLARDGEAQARPFDPASRRNLALVERFEYSRPLVRFDARPLVDDIQYGKITFDRKIHLDR